MDFRLVFLLLIWSGSSFAVPVVVNSPVDTGEHKMCFSNCSGNDWRFNFGDSPAHRPGAGIGRADDSHAWDITLPGDSDDGMPVYAVESGCKYKGEDWGGSSFGQVLLEHNTNGDKWSSGYLHMRDISPKNCFERGQYIGRVSNVSPDVIGHHLHFAVYDSHGKQGMKSVERQFRGMNYIGLRVLDFKQMNPVGIYKAACYEGDINNEVGAEFKVQNVNLETVSLDGLALSIHFDNGNFESDAGIWMSDINLSASGSEQLWQRKSSITHPGKYLYVAKANYGGQWYSLASLPFTVAHNNSCGVDSYLEKANRVFDFIQSNESQYYVGNPPTQNGPSNKGSPSYYRWYSKSGTGLYAWTDGYLYYYLNSNDGWRRHSTINQFLEWIE